MIKRLKPKSEFFRNVLTLITGTTIAQAIPIAISPILTRIYTPDDFGVVALFVAISTIFGSLANGSYELAIILPKKDEDAVNLVVLSLFISIIVSLLLFANTKLLKNIITDKKLLSAISIENMYSLAKRYKRFSQYSTFSVFLNTSIYNLNNIMPFGNDLINLLYEEHI